MIFLKKKVQIFKPEDTKVNLGTKKPAKCGLKSEYGSRNYQSEFPEELSSLGRASFTRRGRPSIS